MRQYKSFSPIDDGIKHLDDYDYDYDIEKVPSDIEVIHNQHKFMSMPLIRLMSLIVISIVFLIISMIGINYYKSSSIKISNNSKNSNISIVLLGDSLINVPFRRWKLQNKIDEQLDREVNLYNYGINGNRIISILDRVDNVLNESSPQYVILFWDTDCSDTDESTMDAEQIMELRDNYRKNLIEVCTRIKNTGSLLAISSPGLLGEGWIGLPQRFAKKTEMLDAYKKINQEVAQLFSSPFIDVRQEFLNAVKYWPYYSGMVTSDGTITFLLNITTYIIPYLSGEHPNNYGSQIIANLFSKQINTWLRS